MLAALALSAAVGHGTDVTLDVSWPTFLARHDMLWVGCPFLPALSV